MRHVFCLFCVAFTVALTGCDTTTAKKPSAKTKTVAKKNTTKKNDSKKPEAKTPKTFNERLDALTDQQRMRYFSVNSDIGIKESRFFQANERLREIVPSKYGPQGTMAGTAYICIEKGVKANAGPEYYDAHIKTCREQLIGLRKEIDDAKRECPDTPAVLNLYRACRNLVDGMERQVDEQFAPLKEKYYDDKLTIAEKKAAFEEVRLACIKEANVWVRERKIAYEAYHPDATREINEIILKKTLEPSFKPTITTIPPPMKK